MQYICEANIWYEFLEKRNKRGTGISKHDEKVWFFYIMKLGERDGNRTTLSHQVSDVKNSQQVDKTVLN